MPDFHEFEFPRLRRRLLAWFRREGRTLPWKDDPSAYRVWISEIMLQQTTVAAVIPYFERFLSRFPDVAALAYAKQDDVLRLWEGLGYYSRARNLHKAAETIVSEFGGMFPQSAAELQALPGIGRYTAGAIASFAFDRPAPIVEANTLRLYCRLLGYDGDPRSSEGQQLLWDFATAILPRRGAGAVNQALMDVGATVCTPKEPDCPACPVNRWCRAFAAGRQQEIPRPKAKQQITDLQDIAVAILDGKKVLVRQRQPDERWAGLWDFPRWTSDRTLPDLSTGLLPANGFTDEIERRLTDETGLQVALSGLAQRLRHSVTRYRIDLFCFTAKKQSGRLRRDAVLKWVALQGIDALPLSVTGRKFARRLQTGGLFDA